MTKGKGNNQCAVNTATAVSQSQPNPTTQPATVAEAAARPLSGKWLEVHKDNLHFRAWDNRDKSVALGPYNDRRNPRRFLALIDGPVDASRFSTGVAAGIELIDGALKVTIHLFDPRQGWTKINELDLEEMVVLHKLGDE